MMYNVLEARNNLSKLIADVESGIEVTIARRGVPVARIVPIDHVPEQSRNPLAAWLRENPLTPNVSRSDDDVDAEIRELREAGA
jgi:prevent-host-death family protein